MTRFSKPPVSAKDQEFLRDSAKWAAIQAEVIPVDAVAREMERTWGAGRLFELVSPDTLLRFRRGYALWAQAVTDSDLEAVRTLGPKMIAAWRFMDKEANSLGATPLSATHMEARMEDGRVLIVVGSYAEAIALSESPDGRARVIYTMEELARVLPKLDLVNQIKWAFEGATIDRVVTHSEGFAEDFAQSDERGLQLHEMEEAV
jgi:hypothetical protein